MGAVHYLLLKGSRHPLRNFYPSIVNKPKSYKHSFPFFKDFCTVYKVQITSILKEKMVQTNEVRRCSYLYPSFSYAYNIVKKPLALIEIGTSAGFQLLWDKYSYSYHSDEHFGNPDSNVHIISEIKGNKTPHFPEFSPPITYRYGIDLHINDLSKVEDSLWLHSLIWPEHNERRLLFEQALECVIHHKNDLTLIEGDGVDLLPSIVEQIPSDSTPCIFHTHVANQIPIDIKQKLIDKIRCIANKRNIVHIYNNMWDRDLHLDYFINGNEHNETIAETDGHGRWFRWKL